MGLDPKQYGWDPDSSQEGRRKKPMPLPGGGLIVHLMREHTGRDQYHLPDPFGSEMSLSVGPGAFVSKAYLEHLRREGWDGLQDIPDEFVTFP